ncbi:2-hydroxy-3-oxopropionate reductase [Georgenia halophila]|uniref:2-hydroxy-3-oxopropionate reductase n=1 Tax=Georgenia halophila TaxID=620889 RepID=A0ABP8LPB5_9MICO
MQIGFIGLGVMGRPMAHNLIDAGHALRLHRVKEISQPLVDAGGTPGASPREVTQGADVVILMVPDTPDVEEVLFGEDGVAAGLAPGTLVIDMSSISPVATKDFARRITELGGEYVDAPVSGGEAGARDGTLTIMAGGTAESFARARPLLDVLGGTVTRIGDVGSGQTAKVANQIVVALTIEAVGEALTFTRRAGADPAVVREALLGGFASSKILQVHGQRMIDREFTPGFRMRLHRKDLGLALESASSLDLALPATAGAAQLMNAALARGDGDADHSALVRAVEHLSGIDGDADGDAPSA